ncbi:MAG: hypothetical protein B1H13_15030 [Desulfobacteraceae bacterium 4484_190.3]|nr:MAG: hypothetical protein B1H13_15030 [Desulfobacteraceae bacterium 4484_190.3]
MFHGGMLSSAANGVDDFLTGVQPPPGLYFLNYTFYYSSNRFKDTSKNEVDAGPLADFKADIYGDVLRFIWVPEKDIRILGGKWVPDFGIPIMHKRIKTAAFDKSETGIGDIVIAPANLFYRWKDLHAIIYADFFVPTGKYDKDEPVNIGNNHWTIKPTVALTYMRGPWETTGIFHYDIHTTNNDYIDPRSGKETSHRSGDAFHVDFTFSRAFTPKFRAGLIGYFYQDLKNDKVNGKSVSDTKTGVWALGAGASRRFGKTNIFFKFQEEFLAENRPEGRTIWLRLVHSF